jgi:hypothetical protein
MIFKTNANMAIKAVLMTLLVEIQVVFLHLDNELDKLFNFFMILSMIGY